MNIRDYVKILEVDSKKKKIYTKLNKRNMYFEILNNIYNISDDSINCLNLFNFNIINEYTWSYDGYLNFEVKSKVVLIKNENNKSCIYCLRSYLFEQILNNKYSFVFYNELNKSKKINIKDIRGKDVFLTIGFDLYDLPYYINITKKNYIEQIKNDKNNFNNNDLRKNSFLANKEIDLIPIFFKNEALFLMKDNNDLFEFLLRKNICRQENNFFIFTKDIHRLNNFILNKLEFFNYYDDKDCFIEDGLMEIISKGNPQPSCKNKLDILKDNIHELCNLHYFKEEEIENIIKRIIIPTEKTNETIFAHNIKIIFEDIIKPILDNNILKNKRNSLESYIKNKKNEPPEVMNKYLAELANKPLDFFNSTINPIKNFRNMYSHDSIKSYNNNYKKNYTFVEKGSQNKYLLNKNPKLNNYNHMTHTSIEDLNKILLEIIKITRKK